MTPSPSAIPRAISSAASRSRALAPCAGAMTSAHTPSRWIDSTTGHAAMSPEGRRATDCASSRA